MDSRPTDCENERSGKIVGMTVIAVILMALQAGLPLFNFTGFERERQEEYFAAVRHGLDRNYKPMEEVSRAVITLSLEVYGE